jgi:hypothetical protein
MRSTLGEHAMTQIANLSKHERERGRGAVRAGCDGGPVGHDRVPRLKNVGPFQAMKRL